MKPRLLSLTLALLASNCLFSDRSPTTRLCGKDAQCRQWVSRADRQYFDAPYDAVRYGLAYLHETHPKQISIGAVYEEKGKFFFIHDVGTETEAHAILGMGVVAYFRTHIGSVSGSCSLHDYNTRLRIEKHYRKVVPYYVQHRLGKIKRCGSMRVIK